MNEENPYSSPTSQPQDGPGSERYAILKEIEKQAGASLIWGIVGILCFGIILGPFAIYRGNKAKRLIDQHNIGHEHRGKATAGFICGIIGIVSFFVGILIRGMALSVGGGY